MKTTIGVALTIVGVVAVVLVIGSLKCGLDPVCRAAEQAETQLQAAQVAKLAPLDLWVGRILRGALIAVAVALALAALALVPAAWAYFPARAKIAAAVAWSKFGLPPWLVQREAGRLVVSGPGAEPTFRHAAEARALMAGAEQLKVGAPGGMVGSADVPRLTAGVVRQILNPKQDEALLPEPEAEPLRLPARAFIYTAPLPSEPALLLGVGAEQGIALPLRNLGGGVIGGLQGMGKSELMAALMAGLLRQDASGRQLRLGLIDMKGGLDFARMPGDLAAWQWPIATDEMQAVALVAQLRAEIDRRTQLLVDAGVANIEAYNSRNGNALPYLVTLVDELMLLTAPAMSAGLSRLDRADSREFIRHAQRCLAVGRATGVSLIMATQKPSADVVPTSLRDLAGFKVAFRCATIEASRAILGQGGAELLPNDPGRALMWRGDGLLPMRSYLAGIETGDFDRFTSRLERSERLALPADAEADGLSANDLPDGTIPVYRSTEPQNGHFSSATAGIPVHVPPDMPPSDAEHKRHIYRRYLALGSLKATEREIYGQEGGAKFYWVRDVVNEELLRRKRPQLNEDRP